MKTNIIWTTLFLFFLLGCGISKKPNALKDFKFKVNNEILTNFDFTLLEKIDTNDFTNVFSPDGIHSVNFCGIFVGRSIDPIKAHELLKDYKPMSEFNIDNFNQSYKDLNKLSIIPDIKDTLVIPKDYLSKKVMLYLKKEKSGIFLNENYFDYFDHHSHNYHGYSVGAIIDEDFNRIVYWLIIK